MTTIHKNSRKRKSKDIKRKNRSEKDVILGTPRASLNNVPHKQKHELLSDWSDAS